MSLISIGRDDLPLGEPLPWTVRDQDGNVLLNQGQTIETEQQLASLLARQPMRELNWTAPTATPAPEESEFPTSSVDAALAAAPQGNFSFQDMRLRVGDRIQLQPPATVGQERHIVRLIGYLDNATLLVTAPKVNGLRVPLRENDKIVARIFTSQKAFGFSSVIERICKIPYDYMHLAFPTSIQSSVVRKAPRVRTKIIASIATPDAAESSDRRSGIIANLSADGALIKARQSLCGKGDTIRMSFRVNLHNVDALLNVQAIVRNVFNDDDKPGADAAMINHGVQFQNLPPNDSVILQSLIYQQMIEQPQTLA